MKKYCVGMFALMAISLLTMGLQCYKDFPITPYACEISEKLSLTPYRKTYFINDTIWVQFQTSDKTLYDKLSRSRIAADTTSLPVRLQYHKRYPIDVSMPGDVYCSFMVLAGLNPVVERPIWYNTIRMETDCVSSSFFVKVGIIPKTTGIYSIELPTNGEVRNCPARLTFIDARFAFTFQLADCNKDIYLSIPPASRSGEQGFTDVRIDNKEIFVFKVE